MSFSDPKIGVSFQARGSFILSFWLRMLVASFLVWSFRLILTQHTLESDENIYNGEILKIGKPVSQENENG